MPMIFVPVFMAMGLSAFAATVASSLLEIGLAIGISAIAAALAPKPGIRGSTLQVSLNANDPRRAIVGRVATAGALVTFQTWGNNNEWIVLLFRVADHKCNGLVSVFWSGGECTVGSGGQISQFYADGHDNCWVSFSNGDWNQSADSDMVAQSSGRWTGADRGRGVAYVKIKARNNNTAFPGGINDLFQFLFVVDGASLYDRRQDTSVGGSGTQRFDDQSTWTLSANAAVVTENLLRGIRVEDTSAPVGSRSMDYFCGLRLTDAVLPFPDNVAAMNHCDEAVSLKAGGTEPRYTVGGVVTCDQTFETILSDFLATMGGKLMTGVGRFVILPGVTQTSVRTFQDSDLRLDGPYRYTQDIALDTIVNAVTGQFLDPIAVYSPQPLPPRTSTADEITDGGYKADQLDLSYVTSETQGQRVQEIHRQRGRRQKTAQITIAPENLDLEAGDWITWNSARYGWTTTFEIVQVQPKATDQEADTLMVVLDLTQVNFERLRVEPGDPGAVAHRPRQPVQRRSDPRGDHQPDRDHGHDQRRRRRGQTGADRHLRRPGRSDHRRPAHRIPGPGPADRRAADAQPGLPDQSGDPVGNPDLLDHQRPDRRLSVPDQRRRGAQSGPGAELDGLADHDRDLDVAGQTDRGPRRPGHPEHGDDRLYRLQCGHQRRHLGEHGARHDQQLLADHHRNGCDHHDRHAGQYPRELYARGRRRLGRLGGTAVLLHGQYPSRRDRDLYAEHQLHRQFWLCAGYAGDGRDPGRTCRRPL